MTPSRAFLANAVLLVSAALSACVANRDPGASARSDAKITADVQSAIAQHPDLGPPNQIYVATHDGVVYLSGLVDNGLTRQTAQDLARQVPGVSRVQCDLTVDK
jgi:osmotically-inducible protein OsmY